MSAFEDRQDAAPAVETTLAPNAAASHADVGLHRAEANEPEAQLYEAVEQGYGPGEQQPVVTVDGDTVAEASIDHSHADEPEAPAVIEDADISVLGFAAEAVEGEIVATAANAPADVVNVAEATPATTDEWLGFTGSPIDADATDPVDIDWAAGLAASEFPALAPGDDGEPRLLDDELEHGIASVFAALHSAAQRVELGDPDEPEGPLDEAEAMDGITFRLLGELDRLWHRAA